MSANPEANTPRSFRRYDDGDHEVQSWRQWIFDGDRSHKCPTYVQSTPPCQGSCPAGEDIRGYLAIVRGTEKPPEGVAWQEYAWRRLTAANPFPAVMGRVCPAPCESGCNRNEVEDHVGINSVEHFLGDYAIREKLAFAPPRERSGRKVAVVGGGPAGLSCAYQLSLRGHSVTIFEERAQLGGMMRYGIPGFRTPRETLDAEIARILALGIEARTGVRIGRDIEMRQIEEQFDAVFLGLGAQSGRPLPIADGAAPNVVSATAFLRAFNEGRLQHVGRRVVVVGGGDTSIDVATVARRLGHIEHAHPSDTEAVIGGRLAHDAASALARRGCEVTLTAVFAIDKMQASPHEVEQALAEGIAIRGGVVPVGLVRGADGRADALRVARCTAKMVGPRLDIQVEAGTEEDIPADLIVSAIGQAVDFSGLEQFDNGRGAVGADKNGQLSSTGRVFAGGDVLRPHLLTTAVGQGAIAAEGIDRLLRGEEIGKRPKVDVRAFDLAAKMREKGLKINAAAEPLRGTDRSVGVHNFENRSDRHVITHEELYLGHFAREERVRRAVTTLDPQSALGNFQERLQALTEEQALAEAKRCMSCGMCFECDNCVVYCPQKAVYKVPRKEATLGRYVATDYTKCVGCHICKDVCPTGYIQMGLGE